MYLHQDRPQVRLHPPSTRRAMKHLSGLQKICRMYGRMKVGDTMMVWDYANEEAVPQSKMKDGSKRWKASEKARFEELKKSIQHP
jgi:hypothetical protein